MTLEGTKTEYFKHPTSQKTDRTGAVFRALKFIPFQYRISANCSMKDQLNDFGVYIFAGLGF